MRMIWNGAALAAVLALFALAAIEAGIPALASTKVAAASRTPGGKFADRLAPTLPAFAGR